MPVSQIVELGAPRLAVLQDGNLLYVWRETATAPAATSAGGFAEMHSRLADVKVWYASGAATETHSGKVRSMPPAVPRWLRRVKDVRKPRFLRAMHRPFVVATRRWFWGMACSHISHMSAGMLPPLPPCL